MTEFYFLPHSDPFQGRISAKHCVKHCETLRDPKKELNFEVTSQMIHLGFINGGEPLWHNGFHGGHSVSTVVPLRGLGRNY